MARNTASRKARESKEDLKKRATRIGTLLARAYPGARCSLDYANPFQLYVATVLSAQCTDERVNKVTPELFRRYPGPRELLKLGQAGLEKEIQSTGFFRNKSKSILGGCARMIEAFGGDVPKSMAELLTIPGVGRKTANVILGNAYGIQEGVVVDTHVGRVSQRLRLTGSTDPVKIEQDLVALFPRKGWTVLAHRMILHGRNVCAARSPRCDSCVLLPHCPFGQAALLEASAQSRAKAKKRGAAAAAPAPAGRTRRRTAVS